MATSSPVPYVSCDSALAEATAVFRSPGAHGIPWPRSPPEGPATKARITVEQDQKPAINETSARGTDRLGRDSRIRFSIWRATSSTDEAALTTKAFGNNRNMSRYASLWRCDSAGDTSDFLCCTTSVATSSRT